MPGVRLRLARAVAGVAEDKTPSIGHGGAMLRDYCTVLHRTAHPCDNMEHPKSSITFQHVVDILYRYRTMYTGTCSVVGDKFMLGDLKQRKQRSDSSKRNFAGGTKWSRSAHWGKLCDNPS